MKAQKLLFLLILSGMMSFIVSGISTFKAVGLNHHFVSLWLSALDHCMDISFPKCIDLCSYSPEISRHHI